MKTTTKLLCFIILAVLAMAGCSKNEDGPDNSDLMINATAYIGDVKGKYDIAFYPVYANGNVPNPISNDVSWVNDFMSTYDGYIERGVEQYSEYVKPDRYHIIIKIIDDPNGDLEGVFTIKQVDVRNQPSMDNVMEFSRGREGWFQEWSDRR